MSKYYVLYFYFLFVYFTCFFVRAYSDNSENIQLYSRNSNNRAILWMNCAENHGVCIKSGACPWDRVIPDKDECLEHNRNSVCCQIAHVRMPVDIFDGY